MKCGSCKRDLHDDCEWYGWGCRCLDNQHLEREGLNVPPVKIAPERIDQIIQRVMKEVEKRCRDF